MSFQTTQYLNGNIDTLSLAFISMIIFIGTTVILSILMYFKILAFFKKIIMIIKREPIPEEAIETNVFNTSTVQTQILQRDQENALNSGGSPINLVKQNEVEFDEDDIVIPRFLYKLSNTYFQKVEDWAKRVFIDKDIKPSTGVAIQNSLASAPNPTILKTSPSLTTKNGDMFWSQANAPENHEQTYLTLHVDSDEDDKRNHSLSKADLDSFSNSIVSPALRPLNATRSPILGNYSNFKTRLTSMMGTSDDSLINTDISPSYLKKSKEKEMKILHHKFCLLCLSTVADSVLMDCGHAGLCIECAIKLVKTKLECYLCREKIKQILRVDIRNNNTNYTKVLECYDRKGNLVQAGRNEIPDEGLNVSDIGFSIINKPSSFYDTDISRVFANQQ